MGNAGNQIVNLNFYSEDTDYLVPEDHQVKLNVTMYNDCVQVEDVAISYAELKIICSMAKKGGHI